MKKILSLLFALVCVSEAKSSMSQRPRHSVYFGGQVGYARSTSKLHVTQIEVPPASGDTTSDISGGSFAGGAHLGYGYRFSNCFYMGIEGRYNAFNNRSAKETSTTLGAPLVGLRHVSTLKGIADVSVLLGGYVCDGTLVYARIGAGFGTRQTLNTYGSFGTVNANKTHSGFMAGVGAKFDLGCRFYLGFDYTVNSLGNFDTTAINSKDVKTHLVSTRKNHNHMVLFSFGGRLMNW